MMLAGQHSHECLDQKSTDVPDEDLCCEDVAQHGARAESLVAASDVSGTDCHDLPNSADSSVDTGSVAE
eukprot:1733731-Amphidinium_carterae.1